MEQKIIELCKRYDEFRDEVNTIYRQAIEDLTTYNYKQEDLLHEIENLTDLDDIMQDDYATNKILLLNDIRVKRRECKNAVAMLGLLYKSIGLYNAQQLYEVEKQKNADKTYQSKLN